MSAQRRSPRVEALHLISYEVQQDEEEGQRVIVGRTLNVSESGLLVETDRRLDLGQHLELEIAVRDEVLRARGRVVRSQGPSDDLFETGIEFLEMSAEDRAKLVDRS